MARHRKSLDFAMREALAILEAPMATIYNTEGHLAYYDEDGHTSVNVWHCPILRKAGCTEIHTHQFHGCSTILDGTLIDQQFDPSSDGEPIELVKMMPGEWRDLGTVHERIAQVEATHTRGDSYCIPYDRLHRALTPGLAVTLFQRTEVHRAQPIKMQVGGRLGTGGITWTPGPSFTRLLPVINHATRDLLTGVPNAAAALEALLREASVAVDEYLPA